MVRLSSQITPAPGLSATRPTDERTRRKGTRPRPAQSQQHRSNRALRGPQTAQPRLGRPSAPTAPGQPTYPRPNPQCFSPGAGNARASGSRDGRFRHVRTGQRWVDQRNADHSKSVQCAFESHRGHKRSRRAERKLAASPEPTEPVGSTSDRGERRGSSLPLPSRLSLSGAQAIEASGEEARCLSRAD